ncbi:hypothetical protein ABPG73_021216 [Tetrahymena malaccensis]
MNTYQLIVITSILVVTLKAQCQSGEIYHIIKQQCLPCSKNCLDCFNTSANQCVYCAKNFLQSYSNTSTCVQNCQIGEFQTLNLRCEKCKVEGCAKCDFNQNCLQCNQNLKLDLVNNNCYLSQDVCSSKFDFIQSPFTIDQCVKSCPSPFYQNQNSQICEKNLQCVQFNRITAQLNERVNQIEQIYQNQYLIRANKCQFAVADQNFQIIYTQVLQNIDNFESLYMYNGQETNTRSFIIGNYGGCTANKTLVVMDFLQNRIVFKQINFDYDYYLLYADTQNQVVFLKTSSTGKIVTYNALTQQLNFNLFGSVTFLSAFQIKYLNSTNYYLQKFENPTQTSYMPTILKDDRTIIFTNNTITINYYWLILRVVQKNDYLIGVFNDTKTSVIQVSKIQFQNITNISTTLLFSSNKINYMVYYSVLLNSIIYYDQQDLNILILDSISNSTIQHLNITCQLQQQFYVYESSQYNSTFAFFITKELLIINITDYVLKSQQQKQPSLLIQNIGTTFITNLTTITNVLFQENNIIQIFLNQILQPNSQNYQQIRLQYNAYDQMYSIKYLDPLQYQKLYYTTQEIQINQNQNQFSINKNLDKNSFYIYDQFQVFTQQSIGVQKVKYALQNLQKNSKTNTRFFNFLMDDNQTYFDQFIQINYKYFLISKIINKVVNEYIIEINSQKQVISYQYPYISSFSKFYYIQKRNLLIVQNVPQIFSLDNSQPIIQDPLSNNFSLENFAILNDDQILYIAQNQSQEYILYLIDLKSYLIQLLYNFGQDNQPSFYIIDKSIYYPLVAFNDILYLNFYFSYCQPFSLSQKQLIYSLTYLVVPMQVYTFLNYQKTGEIFIFLDSLIYVYSYDLSQYKMLKFGVSYPYFLNTLNYNSRFVFYYDQSYLYRFDMELKQINFLNAQTDKDLYKNSQINFYSLDNQSFYIKKSRNLIETNNMIIINSSLDYSRYIGNLITDDNSQIQIFQSQNGVFWHINLFNNPFNVINISNSQQIQYNQLQRNKIAFYDNTKKQLIMYDILQSIDQGAIINLDIQFDLQIAIVDWDQPSFVWVKGTSIYQYNQNSNPQIKSIFDLDSQIVFYQYCPKQKIMIVKTDSQTIYQISIKDQTSSEIDNYDYGETNILLDVNCEEELIVIYCPYIQIIDLITGLPSESFAYDDMSLNLFITLNPQCVIPLVSKISGLVVVFYSQSLNSFFLKDFTSYTYLFEYRYNNTNLYYDEAYNILVGVTGKLKQINLINIPGIQQLSIYQCVSQFENNAVYFNKQEKSVIIADNTPILYLFNYLTQNLTQYNIEISNIIGLLMDENKKVIFLYSNQFIQAYQFPDMKLIETLSLQNYNTTSIIQVFLNTQLSLITAQTSTNIISFDLTETVYTSETYLLQYQKNQNLNLDQQFQVSYNIVNFSLNLFKNAQLIDTLLFEPSLYNIFPYLTELILIKDSLFVYIQMDNLNIINADLIQQKLILVQKVKLISLPDNFFYDLITNKFYILYQQNYQLSMVDLNVQNIQETKITNFSQVDIASSLICSNFIIMPSTNIIYSYDIMLQQTSQLAFSSNQKILFALKLQTKDVQKYQSNWWNIPFNYEEKFNNNDTQNVEEKLILVITQQGNLQILLIIDVASQQITYSYQLQYSQTTNVVCDPFRKLIYLVNNKSLTLVFSYNLALITSIQNGCLKQAIISFDSNYIYSICPNDIIIYNALSFQQQFPIINSGIREVQNFINTMQNNYFIIVSKNSIQLIQLDFLQNYELIYYLNQSNQQLQNMQLTWDNNQQAYLILLFSSYESIQYLNIALQQNSTCFINIQQQNRTLEKIYTDISLYQSLTSLQTSNQKLKQIELQYQEGQYLQSIDLNEINRVNIDQSYLVTLILKSESQLINIYWSNVGIYSQYIQNIYLKNMNLSIQNQISLNENKQLKNFQMFNITLNIQQSLIIQNFGKVFLQNLTINNQNLGLNQIIIKNCQIVVIEQVDIINIQTLNSLFLLTNNTIVTINKINISKSNSSNIFEIDSNQSVNISYFFISQSNQLQALQILLSKNVSIANFNISQVQFSQIIVILGSNTAQMQAISVDNSNQLKLIQMLPYTQDDTQYLSRNFSLQKISLTNSTRISLNFDVNTIQISDLYINQLEIVENCFSIVTGQLNINKIKIFNSKIINNQTQLTSLPAVLQISSYNNCIIQEVNTTDNNVTLLSLNQQGLSGNTLIQNFYISNFNIQNSLIELINIDSIKIDTFEVININVFDSISSSILLIKNSNKVTIIDSKFENNVNVNGFGGSIYSLDNQNLQISNSLFQLNKCLHQNGGALSIINTIQIGNVLIQDSIFIENLAQLSTGGAMSLQNTNLSMKNTTILNNKAVIGGGVYYKQVIPDFIFDLKSGIDNSTIIKQNSAKLYGNNIGSTLRSIQISLNDIKATDDTMQSSNANDQIIINHFKSGDQIQFEKIQLIDEENSPLQISTASQFESLMYSDDVLAIIQLLSLSIQQDQSNQLIQCIGQLETKQFIDNIGYQLNAQVIYKPKSQMSLQIVSNIFPQLIDSSGKVYLKQGVLSKSIVFNFDDCQVGQIVKQYSSSIICETCEEGKYSLNKQDSECQICPNSAVNCFKSTISLKNGFWRKSENTDIISYCNLNPLACQAESPESKQYCSQGYKGPICYSCDVYGEIWGKKYSEMFSPGKCYNCSENIANILIQNILFFLLIFLYILAILKSILTKLQAKLAGYFINRLDILYLGSTIKTSEKSQILSKIFTDHLQILSLFSFFSVNIPNYFKVPLLLSGDESYLDLDFSVKCFDPEHHLPYMIYFSIPVLFIWILVMPLILFLKIRNGKLKNWSIFTEIKYSIIFGGHKEKFYYWEFGQNFYGQESFQQLFNIQSTQIQLSSRCPQQELKSPQQTDRFILQDINEQTHKEYLQKMDSIKNKRDKWSYYSRSTKQNMLTKQIATDQDSNDYQESRSPQSRFTNILESARGQYTTTSNYDQEKLTKDFNNLLDKSN